MPCFAGPVFFASKTVLAFEALGISHATLFLHLYSDQNKEQIEYFMMSRKLSGSSSVH